MAAGQFAGKRLPTATKQPASKRPRCGGGSGGRNGDGNDDEDDMITEAGDIGRLEEVEDSLDWYRMDMFE